MYADQLLCVSVCGRDVSIWVCKCMHQGEWLCECIHECASMCMMLVWCRIMWMCARECVWYSWQPLRKMDVPREGMIICSAVTQCLSQCRPNPVSLPQDRVKYTLSEWTAASPSSAEHRIWSVSICCGIAFSSAFVLLDKNGEQESVFLLDIHS